MTRPEAEMERYLQIFPEDDRMREMLAIAKAMMRDLLNLPAVLVPREN